MSERLGPFRRYRELIDDWPAFTEACLTPLPTVVWANPLRASALARLDGADRPDADDGGSATGVEASPKGAFGPRGWANVPTCRQAGRRLRRRLEARGYDVESVEWYPGALRVRGLDKPGLTLEYYLGIYHVQEEISLLPAVVLGATADDRVLDLCAAPGGKSAQIAGHMSNRGTLVVNDVRPGRLRALRANSERLGLLNAVATAHDGTRYPLETGPFERILLDVPCSCEGNVRQFGDVPQSVPDEFGRTDLPTGRSGLQSTLLGRAWKLLAPGGTLVYATCTFAPEENELVLDHALGDDAEIEPFAVPGLEAAAGVTQWRGRRLRDDCRNVGRYWPHLNDTGGFTVARVRKSP